MKTAVEAVFTGKERHAAVGIHANVRLHAKYRQLPFLVDDVSGSRALALFFVGDGASMIVASTSVPERRVMPLPSRCAFTSAKIASVSRAAPEGVGR